MRYECECGCGFERWNAELNAYVCAQCGTLWEPDTYSEPEQLGHYDWELTEDEAAWEEDREDDGDYFPCDCEFCYCPNLTLMGCKCGDCLSGAHQG